MGKDLNYYRDLLLSGKKKLKEVIRTERLPDEIFREFKFLLEYKSVFKYQELSSDLIIDNLEVIEKSGLIKAMTVYTRLGSRVIDRILIDLDRTSVSKNIIIDNLITYQSLNKDQCEILINNSIFPSTIAKSIAIMQNNISIDYRKYNIEIDPLWCWGQQSLDGRRMILKKLGYTISEDGNHWISYLSTYGTKGFNDMNMLNAILSSGLYSMRIASEKDNEGFFICGKSLNECSNNNYLVLKIKIPISKRGGVGFIYPDNEFEIIDGVIKQGKYVFKISRSSYKISKRTRTK